MAASAWTPVNEPVTLDMSTAQPIESKWTPVEEPLAQQSHDEISAHPGGVKQWLTDLESDLRYGGHQTVVGRALKSAGYQGAESLGGMEGAAGKMMVSPLTGATYAAHGVAEAVSGHPLRGAGQIVSAVGEAAEIPMMFAAPETSEAAAAAPGNVARRLIPSFANAGQKFKAVSDAAGQLSVDISKPGDVALDIQRMAESGGSQPKVIRDFVKRVTDPSKNPLTYDEARSFYSNASRLSADEMQRLTPQMKRMVGGFRASLGAAIQDTASSVGEGDTYAGAMAEYRRAAQFAQWQENAVKALKYGAGVAAVSAVGGTVAGRFMKLGDIVTGK